MIVGSGGQGELWYRHRIGMKTLFCGNLAAYEEKLLAFR